jgi:hypothetical protein
MVRRYDLLQCFAGFGGSVRMRWLLGCDSIATFSGCQVLVPGSHKAVFEHPGHLEHGGGMTTDGALVEAGEEM